MICNLITKQNLNHTNDIHLGIHAFKGIELIIIWLAALKNGYHVSYLDPSFDFKYLKTYIKASNIHLILKCGQLEETFNTVNYLDITYLDVSNYSENNLNMSEDILNIPNNDVLIYALPTSGSSGTPKVIKQTNTNFIHHLSEYAKDFNITKNTNLLNIASFLHDQGILDLGVLIYGVTLYLSNISDNKVHPFKYLLSKEITVIHTLPSIFKYLMESEQVSTQMLSNMKTVILGGEPAFSNVLHTAHDKMPNQCTFNILYGMSEYSYVSHYQVDRSKIPDSGLLPIGIHKNLSPYMNLNIIDQTLYIESVFLFKQYYLNQTATAKVLKNFSYCTNDQIKIEINDQNKMYHIGRADSNIKVRGTLVNILDIMEGIHQFNSENLVFEDFFVHPQKLLHENKIVLYFKFNKNNHKLSKSDISKNINNYLIFHGYSKFMIPEYYYEIDEFPKLNNNKINKLKLPRIFHEVNRCEF